MAKTKVDKPKVAAKTDVKAPIAKAKRTPKKKEVVESKPVTSPVAVGGSAAYSKPKEKPKGAKSAYMHFQQAVYEETVKKIGSNNPRFVMTATAAEWTALKDKTKWQKLAAEDKERYDIECMEYNGVVFGEPCPF